MSLYKRIMSDTINCIKLSSIISLASIISIGAILMITYKGDIAKILWGIRGSLLILGGFTVILGAILIMKKKSEKELNNIEAWKKRYKVLSYKSVIIINGLIIIFYGGIIDWIVIKLR